MTSQRQEETASFTNRNVSAQREQPAVKTSIFLFSAIPIHLLIRLCRLHSRAATLVECFAREFAQELSVLLCFAAAFPHLFAGKSAHHLRGSSRRHNCDRNRC